MNDQVLMDNYLLVLKSTVEVYVHGTLESSNEDVRELLKECLDDTMKMQADTYDKMTEYGWYNVNNVEASTINETLTKLQSQNSDDSEQNTDVDDQDEDTYENSEEND